MTYPDPLKAVVRKLTPNVTIASTSFKRFNKVNFGGRMALFNYDGNIIVWSAIPYGEEVAKALSNLTGEAANHNITHLIIPDLEHTMAAKSFKEKHPNIKIIAMEGVDLGETCPIDHYITSKHANKLIDSTVLKEIGINDPTILNNFQFVYLPYHANKELVTYDLNSKILFEADLLFNLGVKGLEQFSPATGYPLDYYPHLGWSFPTKYLQPYSKVGISLFNKIANSTRSAEGLKAIYKWDFEQIVMCHGNVIDTNAKESFKNVFGGVL